MKTKEAYMFGDWVERAGEKYQIGITLVGDIEDPEDDSIGSTWTSWLASDEFHPIRINRAMLLANGFTEYDLHRHTIIMSLGDDIRFVFDTKTETITTHIMTKKVQVFYVHELQHLLRDIDERELAINFKLN